MGKQNDDPIRTQETKLIHVLTSSIITRKEDRGIPPLLETRIVPYILTWCGCGRKPGDLISEESQRNNKLCNRSLYKSNLKRLRAFVTNLLRINNTTLK